MWKLRTPILCTGVEGTLIVLDALLISPESIPEENLANIYAIALMRYEFFVQNIRQLNKDKISFCSYILLSRRDLHPF